MYSHQKMPLNSSSDIPRLTFRYSGVDWYFVNMSCQAASPSGGSVPAMGCHSTIERPDRVRRVTPPTTTITKTRAAQTSNQKATWRRAASECPEANPEA